MLAHTGRKRSSHSGLLSFFLEDWKFIIQIAGAFVVIAVIEALRSYQFATTEGTDVPLALVAMIHGLTVVSLLVPAYVFALASRALLPQGSQVFRRLLAILLLAAFIACAVSARDRTSLSAFQWSLSDSFQQANYFAAAAGSLFFLSVFVVAYRFIALAGSVFRGMLRLLAIIGLLVGVSLSDRIFFPQVHLSDDGYPSRTRLLLIFDQMGFSGVNDYLNRDADEKILNGVRFFRPVLPSHPSFMGRMATLLTGMEVYEHGIRDSSTHSRSWQLFQENWQERLISFKTQADLHVTNLTAPSRYSDFFLDSKDSLCPAHEDEPSLYSFLRRVGDRLTPFIPRWILNLAIQHGECLPFRVPVDDLIHREVMTQLAYRTHRTNMLLSLWSINFTKYAQPLFQEERAGAITEQPERKHLALFMRSLLENLERAGLINRTEIHVIALPTAQETHGAYFLFEPEFTRGTPWPLQDESTATPLSALAFAPDPTRSADELKSETAQTASLAYTEYATDSADAPIQRSVLCSFALNGDLGSGAANSSARFGTVRLSLNRVAASPQRTIEIQDFHLPPFRTEAACVEAGARYMSKALMRDVSLFEPPLAAEENLQQLVEAEKETLN